MALRAENISLKYVELPGRSARRADCATFRHDGIRRVHPGGGLKELCYASLTVTSGGRENGIMILKRVEPRDVSH